MRAIATRDTAIENASCRPAKRAQGDYVSYSGRDITSKPDFVVNDQIV
ncbi:hypothetical protein KCP77_12045 [Salmonella enterica subsp. enterica]|nr:hypothetical protein KCP77_12045 [Salmonella enterica subsp. enterica]